MSRRTRALRLVLGDQLSRSLSSLRGIDRDHDVVLMVEASEELTFVRHHKQKIVLMLSAMRHFVDDLEARRLRVDHVALTDPRNTGSLSGELKRAIRRHRPERVIITGSSDWRLHSMVEAWRDSVGVPLEVIRDDRFICDDLRFADWAGRHKTLRMESFYHEMRRTTGWLMDGDSPEGGSWNYDSQNRGSLSSSLRTPAPLSFETDAVTEDVIRLVAKRYEGHFGDLDSFGWATKRVHARRALRHFMKNCLPEFGIYQDAMKSTEPRLFHSALSPYLNLGLLDPREVCEAALKEYGSGRAPLNSVEGFIRQILGWREYVRGVYRLKMPEYRKGNYLQARRSLPGFYWTGRTEMACLRQTIEDTRKNAYAHHIQRLMLTGNFALLAGLNPAEVEEWYLIVYADAFDWVELPNTHGMALYADGGLLASKPYAASAAYINRMSDYCRGCTFDHRRKLGPGACPFNYLYWDFLIRNESRLGKNPRMAMPYNTLRRMDAERRARIMKEAESFLDGLKAYRGEEVEERGRWPSPHRHSPGRPPEPRPGSKTLGPCAGAGERTWLGWQTPLSHTSRFSVPDRTALNKKGSAFLKKAFGPRAKLVKIVSPLRFGDTAIAYGGGWGSLESSLDVPEGTSFRVLERTQDGATLLLAEGRGVEEAQTLAKLRWDQFAYRLYFVGATTQAATCEFSSMSPGIVHHESGADVFVHEFTPERTMLALSLHDNAGEVIGIVLGDDRSLAPIAPPPIGCPVLRAILAKYAEIYGPRDLLSSPTVAAALERSDAADKKTRDATATRHAERALDERRRRVAALLERVDGFAEDALHLRDTAPSLKRGQGWPELQALHTRLMEAEKAAHPPLCGELRFEYARLGMGAAGSAPTQTESDLLDLGHRANRATNRYLGIALSSADLRGVRASYEMADLESLYARIGRAALTILAWSSWPDVAGAEAQFKALDADLPSLEDYLELITGSRAPG